jgi:hypothetical protein
MTRNSRIKWGLGFPAGPRIRTRVSKRFTAKLETTSRARVSALRISKILIRQAFLARLKPSLAAAQKNSA